VGYFLGRILYLIIFILVGVIDVICGLGKTETIQKKKSGSLVNTAHDIRTPLTLIKAPLGEILKNENLSEQGRININLAIQNTDNCLS